MLPTISAGMRSGVNWMREYFRSKARARVRIRVVLPSPGTPSRSTCPEASRQIRTPSTTSSCPTMTLAISRRTALSRSTASWSVASGPTIFIVEHAERLIRLGWVLCAPANWFRDSPGIPVITHARWIYPASPYQQRYRVSGRRPRRITLRAGTISWTTRLAGGNACPTNAVPPSLHDGVGGLRLQLDFTKSGFVLRDVLLENADERLGLLRADVDALEIVDSGVFRRGLVHAAEQKKEIPQIHPHLDAVGVVLPVVGCVNQLNLGRGGLNHTLQGSTGKKG